MVGVAVSDDDMCHRRPLFLGDQAPEIEQREVLTRVDRDLCAALLDQERVIQVVRDPHAACFRLYGRNCGNGRQADVAHTVDQ